MGLFDWITSAVKNKEEHAAPEVKPGRNELCWCGSGRKYKKCHEPADGKKQKNVCSLNCGPT